MSRYEEADQFTKRRGVGRNIRSHQVNTEWDEMTADERAGLEADLIQSTEDDYSEDSNAE